MAIPDALRFAKIAKLFLASLCFCLGACGAAAGPEPPLPANSAPPFSIEPGLSVALGLLLAIAFFELWRQAQQKTRQAGALKNLLAFTSNILLRGTQNWRATGVTDVDAVAQALEEIETRLRIKRAKLKELSEILSMSVLPNEPDSGPRILRAMIDAMPVGVVIAEAPGGRIVEGNRAMEQILGHPIIYSQSDKNYGEWRAVHENGAPVESREYPLARALAGEDYPTLQCKYLRPDAPPFWINIVGAPIRNGAGAIMGAIVAVTDIDEIKTAREHRRTMNIELHHRVNNSLTMIQSLANITARSACDFASFRNDFNDRVQCFSRLSLLLTQRSWEEASLQDVIDVALMEEDSVPEARLRVHVKGAETMLRSDVVLAIGVALHELFTNAVQFGALSHPDGIVSLAWCAQQNEGTAKLVLTWIESNGPAIDPPRRTGVGLYLLNNVLARQINGDIDIDFARQGLKAVISTQIPFSPPD